MFSLLLKDLISDFYFIAYIYVHFNHNVDEKSVTSDKTEAENISTQFFC